MQTQQIIYQKKEKQKKEEPFSANSSDYVKKPNLSEKDKEIARKSIEHPEVSRELELKVHNTQEGRLDEVVAGTARVLFQTKAVFPWDFFPDELVVDENKINFIYNSFMQKRVHSVFVRDISDVIVNTSFMFASLEIVDLGFKENDIRLSFLRKSDAILARRIIQGLVIAHKRDIDIGHVPVEELVAKMEELGKVDN
jgi:hypothetical protein